MVRVSPCRTVIVGFGAVVAFQLDMNPMRLTVRVEVAATLGGISNDVATSALTVKTVMTTMLSRRPVTVAPYPWTTRFPDIDGAWNLQ